MPVKKNVPYPPTTTVSPLPASQIAKSGPKLKRSSMSEEESAHPHGNYPIPPTPSPPVTPPPSPPPPFRPSTPLLLPTPAAPLPTCFQPVSPRIHKRMSYWISQVHQGREATRRKEGAKKPKWQPCCCETSLLQGGTPLTVAPVRQGISYSGGAAETVGWWTLRSNPASISSLSQAVLAARRS
jgi:hypothetical protein